MNTPVPVNRYSCDGRTHCSQMSSCEEATFFLNNCPGTKMDGDHDGTPCEEPFCRH
ncbi:excalibur calcium-binding domain-containing protein [Iodobacter fluviatilis]